MLTMFLILVAVASRLTGSRYTAKRFGILALIALVSVICWIAFIAPLTISYFSPTVEGMIQGLNQLSKSGSSDAPSTSSNPLGNTVLEAIGLLVLSVLIAAGAWQAWKRHRRHPWIIGMMIGSLGFFADLGVRLGTPDGQELAGRADTYVYIPVSVLAALALTRLANTSPARRWGAALTAVVMASVVALLVDGLANGWPPFWERLPGPHQVAAFEASVDPEEVDISYQSLTYLGPGNRIASDQGIYPVLIGYGEQNPLQNIANLYENTPKWTVSVAKDAAAANVQYVETDTRLTKSLSPNGSYFPGETTPDTKPLSMADLTKFNYPGVSRVYSDGTITIYDIASQGYVPLPKS